MLRVKPIYDCANRIKKTYNRLDRLSCDYKDKKILIIGDSQKIESNYLKDKGFTNITSTEYEFPESDQISFNIEIDHFKEVYSIIYMSHVLEHTYSPINAMLNVKRMVGDEVYVFLPNEKDGWIEPYHMYSMSQNSWCEMFKRAEFEILETEEFKNIDRVEYFFRLR